MKPQPGSPWRRLRVFLHHCGVRYDRFVSRPRVRAFSSTTAHVAPLIAVVLSAYLTVREFLFSDWKHPAFALATVALMLAVVVAQLTHRPDACTRCLRRTPWGKHRIHAGRAALMASYHASFKVELAVFAFLVLFLIGDRVDLPELLAWANDERVRNVGLNVLVMILMGWIGQARMTHRIYQRSCKRCRNKRRGGGPDGDGGEPVPLPLERPLRRSA